MAKKVSKSMASKAIQRRTTMDGWSNVLTGIGVKGMDKRLSANVDWERLVEVDADNLYSADDMAKKIVDSLVDESFREGYELTGIDKEQAEKIIKKKNELAIDAKFNAAWKMARQYGGAVAFLVTDDMKDLETPRKENSFLRSVTPLSMHEMWAQHEDMNFNILTPGYLTPERYTYQPRVTSSHAQAMQKIDSSRVIRFDGMPLPLRFFRQNNYWGDSVMNPMKNSIRNYQLSHDAASSTLQDFRIAVFKIKNLADQIASDNDDLIIKRMEIANLSRSVARAVMIDADGEDFEYKIGSVSGVNELLSKVENRLVSGTNVPRTILLGESPTGLGGSGRHESQNWYDFISSQQETYLKPKLIEVFKMIAQELGIDAGKLDITFNPMWQLDQSEVVTMRKTQAETDQIYIQTGVVDPDEIAASRFGGDKYSVETEIAKDLRSNEPITPEMVEGAGLSKPTENIQQTALNGAQVSSMIEIVQSVATGNLPRESGLFMLMKAFNMTEAEAERVMGAAGKGFKPSGEALPGQGGGFQPKQDGAFKELEIEISSNPSILDAYKVKQVGTVWTIETADGRRVESFETKEQADERLNQILSFKESKK